MKRLRGYTLIELMISLLLGLMLISGFGSLFAQTQKNATIQRSLSYMMEDGRFILETLGRELRRSGSLKDKLDINGNGDATHVFSADANVLGSTLNFLPGEYIRGQYNAAGFGTTFNNNPLALRYQLFDNTDLSSTGLGSTNSPCERSILLTAGEDPAKDIHVVTLYFYVALDTSNIPVLYCVAKRQVFDGISGALTTTITSPAPEPLISGVQKLLITYGIDSDDTFKGFCSRPPALSSTCILGSDGVGDDGTANYYVDANSIGNAGQSTWQQVVSAKLSVVLRSDDDKLTKSLGSYTIDGTTYTATDNRLYRVFSTTITFRNQI